MATIQIRNVPESVHRTLRRRAAASGQSLQQYVLAELIEHARSRDLADVIAEARAEVAADPAGYASTSALEIIRRERDSR